MLRRRFELLPALLVAALGCATPAHEPGACPSGFEEVLRDPRLLRERADLALEQRDGELAYRSLALLATLHPESAESREAFRAAARLFKQAYFQNRFSRPDSVWLSSEPAFMFQWLARFLQDPEVFPQAELDALFLGMPYSFFGDFTAFAAPRPGLSRWVLRVEEDNGRIQSITGEAAGGTPALAPQGR